MCFGQARGSPWGPRSQGVWGPPGKRAQVVPDPSYPGAVVSWHHRGALCYWLALVLWGWGRTVGNFAGCPPRRASQVALVVKNPPANVDIHKRRRLSPWVEKTPWRRKWQLTLVFLPGESHGQRSLAGCSHGAAELDMAEQQYACP